MDNGLRSKKDPVVDEIVHGSTGFGFLSSKPAPSTPMCKASPSRRAEGKDVNRMLVIAQRAFGNEGLGAVCISESDNYGNELNVLMNSK